MTGSPGLDIATFNLSSTVLIMSTVCSGGSEVAVRHLREKHTHTGSMLEAGEQLYLGDTQTLITRTQ